MSMLPHMIVRHSRHRRGVHVPDAPSSCKIAAVVFAVAIMIFGIAWCFATSVY